MSGHWTEVADLQRRGRSTGFAQEAIPVPPIGWTGFKEEPHPDAGARRFSERADQPRSERNPCRERTEGGFDRVVRFAELRQRRMFGAFARRQESHVVGARVPWIEGAPGASRPQAEFRHPGVELFLFVQKVTQSTDRKVDRESMEGLRSASIADHQAAAQESQENPIRRRAVQSGPLRGFPNATGA